jgi:hypothetical protein
MLRRAAQRQHGSEARKNARKTEGSLVPRVGRALAFGYSRCVPFGKSEVGHRNRVFEAGTMKIMHDDAHTVNVLDEAAMTVMALIVHELNDSLRAHGMEDAGTRKECCSRFLFGLAYALDAGWFIEQGVKYFPKICFLERNDPAEGEHLGQTAVVHVPTQASLWHEYTHGVVSQYFEEYGEKVPGVRTGSYDKEN